MCECVRMIAHACVCKTISVKMFLCKNNCENHLCDSVWCIKELCVKAPALEKTMCVKAFVRKNVSVCVKVFLFNQNRW